MSGLDAGRADQRILVLAPTAKDAELAVAIFARAEISCHGCTGLEELCAELEHGAGAVLLAEEAVIQEGDGRLYRWLRSQPPWSDLPVLVLARPGADSAAVAQAVDQLGNVTVLERPLRVAALVSAVSTALRARRRQYQAREHLERIERSESDLREADRRKDEFLAILAHELRNPLAPIRNSVHILRLTARDDPTIERVGVMLERQVDHMVRLVDDLMEVSRITRGKIELRKEPIEVAAVVRGAVDTSRPLIEAAGHEFSVSIPPEPLILEGDLVRLTQVLANLLNNAAKYTDEGGRIALHVRREGSEVVISVRDNGMGIVPELLPRVFDLFLQGRRAEGSAPGGLGIGLTLVKRLVEMHGGRVEAHSEGAGRGSEFVVRLPVTAAAPSPGGGASVVRSAAVLFPRRVLVVDDNRDSAESMGMLLRMLGAEVRVVFSGADALKELGSVRPDVVLLDIGMPDMDGYEVAQEIRRQPGFEHVPLIALTGWGQEDDRRRTRTAGFDHHLIKPADVNALETLLVSLAPRR